MKLDLGCGETPAEGHVGVDLPIDVADSRTGPGPFQPVVDGRGIIRFDLASGIPWPFQNDSIDGLFSSHVIEHLPAARIEIYQWTTRSLGHFLQHLGSQDALFWFLDEAWRVTKPGGEFLLRWPALIDERTGQLQKTAFFDPTHYRFIPFEQAIYWRRQGRLAMGVSQYRAVCNWIPKEKCQRELIGGIRVVENQLLLVKEL